MTHSRRRDVLKAAGTVAVVGGLAGCAGDDGTSGGQTTDSGDDGEDDNGDDSPEEIQDDGEVAAFRVVHASPDAPNVDIYVDEEAVVEDLGFGEASSYVELDPGTYPVEVTAAGDPDTVVFAEEVEVEAEMVTTAVAYGEAAGGPDTGFAVELLDDDLSDPGDDTARVRLFHAVPDAGTVDVVVTQSPGGDGGNGGGGGDGGNDSENGDDGGNPVLFEGVEFGETATEETPAGDYTLGVVPTDNGDEPVAEFDLSAEANTVYSAFATGYVDPEDADTDAAFEVLAVEDAQGGERADGGTGDGGGEGDGGGDGGDEGDEEMSRLRL